MKRIIGAIVLTVAISGCQTTGSKVSRLAPGIKPDQVVATLGKPDIERADGNVEIYTYSRRASLRPWHRLDYTLVFDQGHLVEFGPGWAKQTGPDDWTIVSPTLGIR